MSEYFPETKSSGGKVEVELDIYNYATKLDLKNGTGVDIRKFAKKVDVASSTFNVDKLETDKLKNVTSGINSLKGKVD